MGFSFNPIQENDWQGLNIVLEQLSYGKAEAATTARQQQAIVDDIDDAVYMDGSDVDDDVIDPTDPDPSDPNPVVEEPTKKELRKQKQAAKKAAREAKKAERKAAREAKKAKKVSQAVYTETMTDKPQAELVEILGVVSNQGVDLYNKNVPMEDVTLPSTGIVYKTQAKITVPSSYYLDLRGIWGSTTTMQYTADLLILRNISGDTLTLTSINETNNVGTAGPIAGGRDQAGAFTASTWIHFFVIYNPTTGDVSSLSSASPTAPTLPAGYTFYVRVGCARFNGSSELVQGYQMGDKVFYNTQWAKWNEHVVDTASSDILAISTYVPSTAKLVHGVFGVSAGTTARNMYVAADFFSVIKVGALCGADGTASTDYGPGGSKDFTLPLLTAQYIWWWTATTGTAYALGINGFTDDL